MILFALIAAALQPANLRAETKGAPELGRPLISLLPAHAFELWLQYDEFNKNLDWFNYQNKAGSSSRIDSHRNIWLGGRFAVTDRLHLQFTVSQARQKASRQREPRRVTSEYLGYDARLQYTFYQGDAFDVAVEVGYRGHQAKRQDFYKYDLLFQGGNAQVTWPGHPLVSADAADAAWLAALRGAFYLSDAWRLTLGVEGRALTVKALMWSEHPLVESLLRKEAPQLNPWNERHLLLTAGLDWLPFENVSLAMHYTYYNINRRGYFAGPTGPSDVDYNSNHQLDGYLFWHVNKQVTLYGHARASRRFILGELPLAYNRRSNHKFKHPFGYASIGLAYDF